MLALVGGACGIAVALWSADSSSTSCRLAARPSRWMSAPDMRMLAFTAVASIAAGILFGLAPALRAAARGSDTCAERRRTRRQRASRTRLRADRILAVVAGCAVADAVDWRGPFVRSLHQLNARMPDIARDRVVIVRVEPKGSDQRGVPGASARLDRAYRDLIQQVAVDSRRRSREHGAVHAVADPGHGAQLVEVAGRQGGRGAHPDDLPRSTSRRWASRWSPAEISTTRTCGERAEGVDRERDVRAAVFPGELPLGRTVKIGRDEREIIGVVKDSSISRPPARYSRRWRIRRFFRRTPDADRWCCTRAFAATWHRSTRRFAKPCQRLDPTLPTLRGADAV